MAVPSHIRGTDSATGQLQEAEVIRQDGHNGLVVFTEILHERTFQGAFAFNSEFGVNFAQNGAFGGTPERVHDGIDSTLWTGSNIIGTKADFNSAARPYLGTYSVLVDNPNAGDSWDFDNGADIDLTGYVALTMQVNVDKDYTINDSISICGWDSDLNIIVGNKVFLEDFINVLDFDNWNVASIPLTAMGLESSTTVDSIRMTMEVKSGAKAPKLYIDEVILQETGAPICFTIRPNHGKVFYIDKFRYSFTDAYDARLVGGTVPNLSYDKILNKTKLVNGIQYTVYSGGEITTRFSTTCIGDLLRGTAKVADVISDGTNTLITMETTLNDTPIKLYATKGDRVEITISDDLTNLIDARSLALGYEINDHTIRTHNMK